ncbi:MAG: nuclear transport factor 2 family protein, partial [Myxococcota bacterium]
REDYIQHSAFVADGRQGLIDALPTMAALKIELHRTLVDGDLVALHQTYEFPDGQRMVAFDVFRTQDGQLAEHWDALQAEVPANQTVSGRSMVDGATAVTDLDKTEANRALVTEFVDQVLGKGQFDRITDYVSTAQYDQHNPLVADGIEGLIGFAEGLAQQGLTFYFTATPIVVAQGNFVLTGSEGALGPVDNPGYAVIYDLFRVEDGKIVEHWDVVPESPDPAALPHGNGFF